MRDFNLKLKYSDSQIEAFFENPSAKYKIFPKGRRAGFTQGAAQAFIEWALDGRGPFLWGDTVAGNVDRYVERYFLPVLKRLPRNMWNWRQQARVLEIVGQKIDFRSADRPENWEGFGYRKIFLNEAGIILKGERGKYLYNNAVMPMMIDLADSQLIAAGTPKGDQGKFPQLWAEVMAGAPGYVGKRYSTYANPFLDKNSLAEVVNDIPSAVIPQEIEGRFISFEGARVQREWLRYGDASNDFPVYLGVDLAIKEKEVNDYTAIVVLAKAPDGRRFVLEAQREKISFHKILEFIKRMASKWNPATIGIEDVAFQAAVIQELNRTTNLPVKPMFPGSKDKLERFLPVEARYERGLITHAHGINPAFEDELTTFPLAGHKRDFVDALVYAFMASGNAGGSVADFEELEGGKRSAPVMAGIRGMSF